jgi:diguanylate cyclase (GGDEF)-like protein
MEGAYTATARERARPTRDFDGRALDAIVRCLADSVGADRVMLVGRSGPGSVPHLIAHWDHSDAATAPAWTRSSVVGRAFEAERAVVVRRRLADRSTALVSEIAAPVRAFEDSLGALYVGFEPPTELDEYELRWRLESYARLTALCLAGELELTSLLATSGFDELTGCLTHAGLVWALEAEVKRSQRHGHDLACCFIDLEDFKRVNDEHGHLEGNRVLAGVGVALREAVRGYDIVGRVGGDEFAVVMPETDDRALAPVAARVSTAARAAIMRQTSIPIGVCMGIAEWDDQQSPIELLDAAETAMREARSRGDAVAVARGARHPGRLLGLTRGMVRRARFRHSELGAGAPTDEESYSSRDASSTK